MRSRRKLRSSLQQGTMEGYYLNVGTTWLKKTVDAGMKVGEKGVEVGKDVGKTSVEVGKKAVKKTEKL